MGEAPADRNEVFNRYRKMLFSIAYRMLGSIADAEDVVQEAFVRKGFPRMLSTLRRHTSLQW